MEIVHPEKLPSLHDNAFGKYLLNGLSSQYEQQMLDDVFILGGIALLGQWTTIYAQYNTGKTLLVLYLIIESITNGVIDSKAIFYVNADDNHNGLTEKLKLAEEYGFGMLAPGHRGFKSTDLLPILNGMIKKGNAKGTIVILDTLKKFTDLMDKKLLREFNGVVRMFVSKGGTVIGLAHVNKRLEDGKPVYAGTSDMMDDTDCAYVLHTLDESDGIKTVEFENKKSRGKVASRLAFKYPIEDGISYLELLSSVSPVEDDIASELRSVEPDCKTEVTPPVDVIKDCIREGINSKMKLVAETAIRAKISKRSALHTIERFTGDDITLHHWDFSVGARGAKQFLVLGDAET